MRIAQLIPSSGRMHCENCSRDVVLLRALRSLGHDVAAVPLYLPLAREAGGGEGGARVFFGGIRVFLADRHRLFRTLPRWLERALDSPWLLGRVAGMAGATEPGGLAATTLSMLKGEQGHQAGQVEELVAWLGHRAAPDVVVLSTALLAGVARPLRERVGAAVVCMLQDEDSWLDGMPQPLRGAVWRELRRRAADVDLFVAVSDYYAGLMRRRLGIPRDRLRVVRPGIDLGAYGPPPVPPEPPVIGYLSPLSRAKGLEDLVKALVILKKTPALADLRLRAAGEHPAGDGTVRWVRHTLAENGLTGDCELLAEPGHAARRELLRGCSVFSVPSGRPEAFGVHVVEALASGVPVVQPRHGAFPEMIELTGGGVLFEPGDVRSLAAALEGVLVDPERARELGRRGSEGVAKGFGAERMAREMAEVFEEAASLRSDSGGQVRARRG